MNENVSVENQKQADLKAGIMRRMIQVAISMLLQGLCLFLAAGTLKWGWAWVYIGVSVVSLAINFMALMSRSPDLIAERGRIGEGVKKWDRPLAGLISLWGFLLLWIVAGLDFRYGWSVDPDLWVRYVALGTLMMGNLLWSWAMASNRFFSGLVRIQVERGHTVASGGPYRIVRHPGYLGLSITYLSLSVMLGSLWALAPTGVVIVGLVVRTALEDKTLQEELEGYKEFTRQTRYRLLPGIW